MNARPVMRVLTAGVSLSHRFLVLMVAPVGVAAAVAEEGASTAQLVALRRVAVTEKAAPAAAHGIVAMIKTAM